MRVEIAPEAVRVIERLPRPIRNRMLHVVERLQRWPAVSGAKPMRGDLAGRFRIRTGDYRLLFRVERERIVIERVGHRDRFYED